MEKPFVKLKNDSLNNNNFLHYWKGCLWTRRFLWLKFQTADFTRNTIARSPGLLTRLRFELILSVSHRRLNRKLSYSLLWALGESVVATSCHFFHAYACHVSKFPRLVSHASLNISYSHLYSRITIDLQSLLYSQIFVDWHPVRNFIRVTGKCS